MKIVKIIFLLFCMNLAAYDARPSCYRDLERNFFEEKAVTTALSLWQVQQGQWRSIVYELKKQSQEAERLIKEKAARYSVNPLQNPFQPDVAKSLLKETMWQIFRRVMIESGFYDPVAMERMFQHIWESDPRISSC